MHKNSKHNPASEGGLLGEIKALQRELHDLAGMAHGPGLGIFRLLPGIGLDKWEDISRRHNLDHWLALPLDGEIRPRLESLQQTLDRLFATVAPGPLGGLADYCGLEDILDMEMERSRRCQTPVSLAILGLDDPGAVTRTHGRDAPATALDGLSALVRTAKRRYDLAAMFDRDRLAVVLSGTGPVQAQKKLTTVLEEFQNTPFCCGQGAPTFNTTCSAGVTCFRGRTEISVRAFMDKALAAMAEAVALGGARVNLSPLADLDMVPRETLVRSSEKKFLFTGKP